MHSESPAHILLIDDNEPRREALAEIFSFIGVSHQVMDFVSWLQDSTDQTISSLALIGRSNLPVSLEKMIQTLSACNTHIVLCLLEEWDEQEQLSLATRYPLLRTLQAPLTERVLTDLLHQAQVARQRTESEREQIAMFPLLIGKSVAMQMLKESMAKVIDRDVNVLITGESGTGKELVARSLHDYSLRSDKPFVPVNCGAIPPELLESELFGHEKGAFTGAVSARAGRFEMAQGGTLFLDEIGDMPQNMQVKLLRVLQERCFERVGSSHTLEVDVRIIAATHKNLEEMIDAGTFREDLYYRLNVYPIDTPPLRNRRDDIVLLLHELAERSEKEGFGHLRFQPSALDSLQRHPWPGNVRELSNLIERLAIMYPQGVVGVSELPEKYRHVQEPEPSRYHAQNSLDLSAMPTGRIVEAAKQSQRVELALPDEGIDLKAFLEAQEQQLIRQALQDSRQVVAQAAKRLNIRRTTLVEKMRKYGIQRQD